MYQKHPQDCVDEQHDSNAHQGQTLEGGSGIPEKAFDEQAREYIPWYQPDKADAPHLRTPVIGFIRQEAARNPDQLEGSEHNPCASMHRISIA
jgi:hypothetical protein